MEPIERLLDTDARALEVRVEQAIVERGTECEVRRRTWWYTSRPPMHEALLIPVRRSV
jgi:hypothetical protein